MDPQAQTLDNKIASEQTKAGHTGVCNTYGMDSEHHEPSPGKHIDKHVCENPNCTGDHSGIKHEVKHME
ncbi:unnamed protein product [Didymodactylos carnosus]|uniref:Uncharacterized protein n=1 Tax=Didymodactylos carnosus TaxID=1234261 RepID=A0A814AK07_9BILA|nr:unnamed protein product [Didymodactylos carnosus]CAF1144207.1 unnamed protein product [Didymodactylos carnosus]CAF3693881.1 unnamed protein product [Didymodactylos carnosus]CAF3944002.1 unnamed protein product [Didymodactylos carnosus]